MVDFVAYKFSLIEGIEIASGLIIDKLIVERDSKGAVDILNKRKKCPADEFEELMTAIYNLWVGD